MSTVSEEKKWLEFIPFIENSPINVIKLCELLQTHPDIEDQNIALFAETGQDSLDS
jgi:hypothetical protein